jgi:hypothetical protein
MCIFKLLITNIDIYTKHIYQIKKYKPTNFLKRRLLIWDPWRKRKRRPPGIFIEPTIDIVKQIHLARLA